MNRLSNDCHSTAILRPYDHERMPIPKPPFPVDKGLHFKYNHENFTHTLAKFYPQSDVEPKDYVAFKMPLCPPLFEDVESCLQKETLVLTVTKGDIVQISMYHNTSQSHPIHIHGMKFWIAATGRTGEQNAQWDKKYEDPDPIMKDTAVLPAGGYLVIRFKADNPGWWMLHCHVDIHLVDGMAALIHVVDDKPFVLPDGIPRCGPNKFHHVYEGEHPM